MIGKAKPLLVFGTKHATIYNLTPTNLPANVSGVQLYMGDFYQRRSTLSQLPQGMTFKRFCGWNDKMKTYLTPYDLFGRSEIKDSRDMGVIRMKCDNGYVSVNTKLYDQIAEMIAPDYLVAFTEQNGVLTSDRPPSVGLKKTINYLKSSNLVKKVNKKTKILVPLELGLNLDLNVTNLASFLQHSQHIDGFVLSKLYEDRPFKEVESLYQQLRDRIDETKKHYTISLGGIGKIQYIKDSINLGMDICEVSYPFLLAQKHLALIKTRQQYYIQKRPQMLSNLAPLSSQCSCYTCKNHNQTYLAHLIACNQPNAKILLSIHNMQQYTSF